MGFSELRPNSKIQIKIPTQFSQLYDKSFIERVGITPDIKTPIYQDAYEELKKFIETL